MIVLFIVAIAAAAQAAALEAGDVVTVTSADAAPDGIHVKAWTRPGKRTIRRKIEDEYSLI